MTKINTFNPEIYIGVSIIMDESERGTTENSKVYSSGYIVPQCMGNNTCGQLFNYLAIAQPFRSSGQISEMEADLSVI